MTRSKIGTLSIWSENHLLMREEIEWLDVSLMYREKLIMKLIENALRDSRADLA